MLIEAFSPQQAGKPFPMTVKAVDVNNAVVKTWSGDTLLTSVNSFADPGIIIPSSILASDFMDGVYATVTARIDAPGTYTVTAGSGGFLGVYSPLLVKPGPISEIRITVPPYAPLNAPFTLSVAGLTADGQIKSDYVPEGPILLKANATSTGYLGVKFIYPEDFSNGVATISNQTYNKSQQIWMTAIETVDNLRDTDGPIMVFGPPVRLILLPQPSVSTNFYWNAWFRVRVNVLDINGYPVANFNDNINFSVMPGTLSAATDPVILPGFETQHFASDSFGSQLFFLKVIYSTPESPTNLLLEAENVANAIADTTTDMKFLKESVFDSFEIVSPADGMSVLKDKPFKFIARAVDNFGLPMVLLASYPVLTHELLEPIELTELNVSPDGFLNFIATSEVSLEGKITYTEDLTAKARFTITPEDISPAGDMVEFYVRKGYNLKDSVHQIIATDTFENLSRYILSAFVSPGTGSAELKFTLIDEAREPAYSFGVGIASDGTVVPIGSGVVAGRSQPFSLADALSDHNVWYRVFVAFDYKFDPALASETLIHLQNSTPDGYPASASVLFDGIQLERGLYSDQIKPTSFSPKGWHITSPNRQRSISGEHQYYEW